MCRVRSRVHFDIAGTLKQKSEQQWRHRQLCHQKGHLTSRECSEGLAVNSVGRRQGREEATSIQTIQTFSLSATQGCAFEMRYGVADSVGRPVVVKSEALSALAALDLRDRDRAAVRAFIVISLVPLSLRNPGHTTTTLVD